MPKVKGMETNPTLSSGHFETLLGYWKGLRDAQGGVPKRASLNPVEIREILPYVFLIERRAPDDLLVRLAGTALDEVSPMPVTGANYLDFCPDEHRPFVVDAVRAVVEVPCGHRFSREVTFQNGRSHIITTLALPMTSETGEARYLIGVTVTREDVLAADKTPAAYAEVKFLYSEFVDLGFGLPEKTILDDLDI